MAIFTPPSLTTAERLLITLQAGEICYDTDEGRFYTGNGSLGGKPVSELADGTNYQLSSQKNAVGGYAGLDASGKILSSAVPTSVTQAISDAATAAANCTNASNITSGTLSAARLPASGVTAGSYGGAASVPVINTDAYGRITGISTVAASATAVSSECGYYLHIDPNNYAYEQYSGTSSTLYAFPDATSGQRFVSLYDAAAGWYNVLCSQLSITNSGLSASTAYDVFVYNSGTVAAPVLALNLVAWSSTSARATALGLQNGIYVKSGNPNYRYLGSVMTNASTLFAITTNEQYVWNMYNKKWRFGNTYNSNSSWTYATATEREYNGGTGQNPVKFFAGLAAASGNTEIVAGSSQSISVSSGYAILKTKLNNYYDLAVRQFSTSAGYVTSLNVGHAFSSALANAGLNSISLYEYVSGSATIYGSYGSYVRIKM